MPTTPPSITALPTAPDPNDRGTFNARAYPWSAALNTFGTELSAVAANVKANADEAAADASSVASQVATATTQAGIATTQAGIATTQANSATASADAAAASFDAFDDRYLGSKTSNPTLDNDGNALLTGALYFNSTSSEMRVWNGLAWVAAYLPASGYATLTGTETLTNKTLTDPKLTFAGSSGEAGQMLVSKGSGLAPQWGDAPSAPGFILMFQGVI